MCFRGKDVDSSLEKLCYDHIILQTTVIPFLIVLYIESMMTQPFGLQVSRLSLNLVFRRQLLV